MNTTEKKTASVLQIARISITSMDLFVNPPVIIPIPSYSDLMGYASIIAQHHLSQAAIDVTSAVILPKAKNIEVMGCV
jgi:hypothetical protein